MNDLNSNDTTNKRKTLTNLRHNRTDCRMNLRTIKKLTTAEWMIINKLTTAEWTIINKLTTQGGT